MRNLTLSDGSQIEVRPLTRGEIKAGRDVGLKYVGVAITPDNFDDVMDYCLGCQFPEDDLDRLPNPDQKALFRAVMAETWATPGEEKNSPTSGPGARTESASRTAGTAGTTSDKKE